jgi:hypothetical protein
MHAAARAVRQINILPAPANIKLNFHPGLLLQFEGDNQITSREDRLAFRESDKVDEDSRGQGCQLPCVKAQGVNIYIQSLKLCIMTQQ